MTRIPAVCSAPWKSGGGPALAHLTALDQTRAPSPCPSLGPAPWQGEAALGVDIRVAGCARLWLPTGPPRLTHIPCTSPAQAYPTGPQALLDLHPLSPPCCGSPGLPRQWGLWTRLTPAVSQRLLSILQRAMASGRALPYSQAVSSWESPLDPNREGCPWYPPLGVAGRAIGRVCPLRWQRGS